MSTQITEQATVNLTIDGKTVSVPKGTTVFNAAKQLGIDLPIFCYHDRMPPFGACRVCLVEVEKMPRLQTSCTLEATEGMVVKTNSQPAVEGRENILEFLLINHPLDCPICDRGGECPLQEHVFNHGPGKSRFFEEKRHFVKPLQLGPVLMLDRERCIVCARCTRFSEHIAGDHALELIDRGYKTEVGTPDKDTPESKFIGNTIMICPVGALTSQVYRFRARPWDNDATSSTCTLCPVGCSLIIDSRDGQIMRTRSRENREINDIWLCDKGWFGYEFTYHPDRLKQPLMRRSGNLEPASWEEALSFIANQIQQAKSSGTLAAFGGNPLTVEENYLFQKLMREGCGVNHIDHRIGISLVDSSEEGIEPGMEISIGECEHLSFAILLGIDLTEEFPVIWLRLRQAINRGATVIFLGHFAPEIAPYLTQTILHAPGQELETLKQHIPNIENLAKKEKNGAIFVGRQYLYSTQRQSVLSELLKLKQATPHLSLNLLEGSGNSMGARLAGMRPDFGPLNEQLNKPGFNALQVLENASRDHWNFLYIAGANPVTHFPSKIWKDARTKIGCLVVQDLFLTETAQQADVVLPTLSFVEKGGSFINIDRHVQTLIPGKEIPEGVYSDAEIFNLLAQKLNVNLTIDANFLKILQSQRLPSTQPKQTPDNRSSQNLNQDRKNSLAATFAPALFDRGVRMTHDPHLIWLAKEPYVRIHPQEGIIRGIKDGDLVILNANQNAIEAKVKLDERVANATIVLPIGFPQIPIHELGTNLMNGLLINIAKKMGS